MSNKQTVLVEDLGKMEYGAAWDYQEQLLKANVQRKMAAREALGEDYDPMKVDTLHHLLLVEHPPVYTLGKSGHLQNLLITEEQLKEKGIAWYHTNRGGDITFHGPGQLVAYPIFDLEKMYTDIGRYLRELEEVIIQTIGHYGLKGNRSPGETGVWLDPDRKGQERKICAMGVRCSRWVTMHGLALNVNTDLNYFSHIVPCGIEDKAVTSIQQEIGRAVDMEELKRIFLQEMEERFGLAGSR